jgi:hypothetical protein
MICTFTEPALKSNHLHSPTPKIMQDGYQKKIHIDELKFIVTNVLGYPQMQNRMKNFGFAFVDSQAHLLQ